MHTIVLATQKGGSGKSTLAIGLALAAQQAGHNVRLIETDKQGTLSKWQCRRGLAEPLVEPIYNAADIENRLPALERGGVTLTIIDTASGITAAATAAIRHSYMTLIPARPSIADIEATAATLGVIKAWKKPFAYILNQTPLRGQRIDAAATTLSDDAGYDLFDVVAQPFVVMRNDHQDAMTAGLAVSEYAPSGKSAEEMHDLWRWVETRLNCAVPAEEEAVVVPEFPILLRERLQSIQAPSSLPTWADTNPSWDACL